MMERCSSVKKKKQKAPVHLLSEFAQMCSSCVLSHPLYLSYFLFFSPYLLRLLAFLSPLFLTTTLLLLTILHDNFSILLENLPTKFCRDEEEQEEDERSELEGFEEFEVYKIVFGSSSCDPHAESSTFGDSEKNPAQISRESWGFTKIGAIEQNPDEEKEVKVLNVLVSEAKENPVEPSWETEGKFFGIPIADQVEKSPSKEELGEEKILGVLISDEWGSPAKGQNDEILDHEHSDQETQKCEKLKSSPQMAGKRRDKVQEGANRKALELTPSSINGGNQAQQRPINKTHSRRRGESVWDTGDGKHDYDDGDGDNLYYSSSSSPQAWPISPSLSNLGSLKKEKEWRRTLACKLFEERNSGVAGGEGMDLLWEAYEKTEGKQRSGLKKADCGDSEEEGEDEEGGTGQLCCLQALKFSAVKMNFGMGKPGFMKISKALKGIGGGWMKSGRHRRHQSSGGAGKKGKSC